MRVFSETDLKFWKENGYVILHDAVSPENLQAVEDAIWEFQQMDRHDPETWYRVPERENGMVELNGSGMVEMYHHPALWANRQLPRVHGAFADLWGTEELWVTIDRCNLNVPNRPGFEFEGFIHWDVDTSVDPLPFDVQGVLAISDNEPGQGGFQCVPGMPARIREWIETQPADRNAYRPDLTDLDVVPVPLKAGDLLIWNSLLPHGVGANQSDRPRVAQYLSMSPAQEDNEQARQWRINSWLHRLAPQGDAFPGDPRQWERHHGTTASLTPLGRKLLGLDSWRGSTTDSPHGQISASDSSHPERSRSRAIPGFGA